MAEEEKQNQEEKTQEELAKEWEEALKAQQESQKEGASETSSSEEDIMSAWEEALKEQKQKASSQESSEDDETCGEEKFELIKDVPLEVTIEVGSTTLPLEEVLKLHPNSIVELDRYIHEPVDIKVNGRLIAKGELYTVKDSYGIKITQIITPQERLKLLEE